MKHQERLHIFSNVEWTKEEIENAEKEEGFKILEHKFEKKTNDGRFVYEAIVEWD